MVRVMWIPSILLITVLGIQHSYSLQDSKSLIHEVAEKGFDIYPHDASKLTKGVEDKEQRNDLLINADLRSKSALKTENREVSYRQALLKEEERQKNYKRPALVEKRKNNREKRKEKKKNKKKNKKNKVRRKRFAVDEYNLPDQWTDLWPNGKVNYQMTNDLAPVEQARVLYVMQMFSQYTPVTFHHSADQTYLSFVVGGGCWSYTGRIHVFTDQQISCCTETPDQRYCNHEIGHALGLYHEHQSIYGVDYLRSNDRAIESSWKQWFHPLYGNYKYLDHLFDLDSPMGYGQYDFSQSYSLMKSITLFDENYELILGNWGDRQLLYYMYKEINQLYDIDTLCPSSTCDFDGYMAMLNGVCECMCPTGLSSTATPPCSDIEVEGTAGDDLVWPENVFLIRINGQIPCPYGFTSDHWIEMMGGPSAVKYDTLYNFDADITSPPGNETLMKIGFCYRNSVTSTATWPKGSYCINPLNGDCPSGFYEGVKKFNNGGAHWTNGLPSGGITVNGDETSLKFCCRNDSHYSVPAVFPRNDDFMLWPLTGQCQEIEGMQGTFQFVKYHNNGDKSDNNPWGLVPRMDIKDGDITLYLCHYIKRTSNCGDTYTLNSTNREVTFTSPNFPANYPERTRCTWAFKTDPGNQLRLDFQEFEIALNPDGTADDEVEVRDIKIGNWGLRFVGSGRLRKHVSIENYLSVILYSNEDNTAKGLNATVSLVDNTVMCYSGRGENYNGKRNITKNFKPCLDWTLAAEMGAPHHPFAFSNLQDSLFENYCRFPDDGLAPWCYVDFNGGFKREYCDVCNLQGCFDNDLGDCSANLTLKRFCSINDNADLCQATCYCEDPTSTSCPYNDSRSDCQSAADSLPLFYDSKESITYCARSAGYCDKMEAESLSRTCNPPNDLTNLIDAPKASYDLGDVIRFSCPDSTKTSNQTCSSTGSWIINSLCEIETACPDDYVMVGDNCYLLIKEVEFGEAKEACTEEGANMLTMKTQESVTLIDALMTVFQSVSTFWIDLIADNSDTFEWGDGTALTFTKWVTKPFVAPEECRRTNRTTESVYSRRSVTKYGNPCLNWASEEVRNIENTGIENNYCADFYLDYPELYCYVNDSGSIVPESCGVIPYCITDESNPLPRQPTPRANNKTYQGDLWYTRNGVACQRWADVNESYYNVADSDMPDGSLLAANSYCRSPNITVQDSVGNIIPMNYLWCFTTTGGQTGICDEVPTCSDTTDCYTARTYLNGTEIKLLNWRKNQIDSGWPCMSWKQADQKNYREDEYFWFDGDSVNNAGSYCRPLHFADPWCIIYVDPPDVWWGWCDSLYECCSEEGYERPYYYKGKRDFAWNNQKCMKWIDVPNLPYDDASFPDGSVALAEDYCRAPDNGDYLFCYVMNYNPRVITKEWCDVMMEKNIKDCVYYDRNEESWKPTYCDNVHDVICEKPVNVPACKDTDEEKCLALFAARPEECKSDSSFFGEDKCRKTCGLCTDAEDQPNTDTCSEPTLNSDVVKVTNSVTVQVGHYFEYSCPVGKVAKGNLKRGCLPDLSLTGENPSCVDQSQVNEWVNNNTMRERRYVDPGRSLMVSKSSKNIIQKDGYLKAWSYFTESTANLTFYVLRQNLTDKKYTLVNYTHISNIQPFRATTLHLPAMNQFPVQQGDYIGWLMLASEDGGIPFDTCTKDYNPEDNALVIRFAGVTNYASPGNQPRFSPSSYWTQCRRYSLSAMIGPQG